MTESTSDWEATLKSERRRIRRRRAWIAKFGWNCRVPRGDVGLALSGGGIRSATFSLGLLRSLSKAKLLPCVDYMSTVSGGGYAGSFFCSLFVPEEMRGPAPDLDGRAAISGARRQARELGPDVLGSAKGRDAFAQLRQGGHYLAPNGASDALFAGAVGVRNWLAVALVTGLSLLALFLLVDFALLFSRSAIIYLNDYVLKDYPKFFGKDLRARVGSPELMGPWLAVLFLLSLWPAACAWSYWFARHDPVPRSRILRLASWQTVVALIIAGIALPFAGNDVYPPTWPAFWRFGLVVVSVAAIAVYGLAEARCYYLDLKAGHGAAPDSAAALAQEDRVRSLLNRWLVRGVFVLLIATALAAAAWLGKRAHDGFAEETAEIDLQALAGAAFFTVTVLPIARWLLKTPLGKTIESQFWSTLSRRLGTVTAAAIGLFLLTAFLTFWSALGYAVISDLMGSTTFALSHEWPPAMDWPDKATPVAVFTGLLLLCVVLLGHIDALLNGSSLASFYGSRLRKAYLGATNGKRSGKLPVPVDKDHPADEIRLDAYYHRAVLAPVHLINVTINETTSKSSRVIQRDRKGKPMSVSPEGCLYPAGSSAEPLTLIKRSDCEDLPLSSWMAISGAAVSTGAGQHTSFATALLAGMTNMRLGYWWYSQKKTLLGKPTQEWVQFYLLRELRASYQGTCANRWYLSDGGHHENSGVYELARRRVPFIIASDNGADPRYEFGDLVNLIRKLRIDHDAEIDFLDDKALDWLFGKTPLRYVFGTLEQVKRRGEEAKRAAEDSDVDPPAAGPYGTLARIRYAAKEGAPPDTPSTLVWIKPRITGNELPDLLQYRDTNLAFPQQPTADQFFDEAQWESYYRLGQLIGEMMFDERRFAGHLQGCRWRPWDLTPLPDESAMTAVPAPADSAASCSQPARAKAERAPRQRAGTSGADS